MFAGCCDVLTADRSAVLCRGASYAGNPSDFLVLPESPRANPASDHQARGRSARSSTVVTPWWRPRRTVSVRASNVDEMPNSENASQRPLGTTPGMGKALGVDDTGRTPSSLYRQLRRGLRAQRRHPA